ncbi:YIF1-domain-containing protein [Dunaliella salina]|uniref:YIF1-domain-containing protein n=1 Tax=Dunaliella salina TaxID=3046 RepID=A0ABQ7H4G0_DUNSA|nr:YIF1-domain-containing protein [Dunaliella salina]|eukprot:KAF5841748.1 YIF1-domain-containing protein [Dunaliella salina]
MDRKDEAANQYPVLMPGGVAAPPFQTAAGYPAHPNAYASFQGQPPLRSSTSYTNLYAQQAAYPQQLQQQQYSAYHGSTPFYTAPQPAAGFIPPGFGNSAVPEGQAMPDQAFPIPGINGPGLNPLNFMTAGSNFLAGSQTWGQQYVQRVQQRMGWLSGAGSSYHFAISSHYVLKKVGMLLAPYLKRWTFTRQPEQVQGTQQFRPPRIDHNAPDLYIPIVAAWTYIILLCSNALLLQKYTPDLMYAMVWSTCSAWFVHTLLAYALLKAMNLSTMVPWSELGAYVGYTFLHASMVLILGMMGGKVAWWISWLYGSLCSSVFLVRTMKRVIFQEAQSYGKNLTLTNYLLLALAAFQFPFLLWCTNVQLPQ